MEATDDQNIPTGVTAVNTTQSTLDTIYTNVNSNALQNDVTCKISRNSPSNQRDDGVEIVPVTVRFQDAFSATTTVEAGTILRTYKLTPTALATAYEKAKPNFNGHEHWRLRWVNFSLVNAEKFNTAGGAIKITTSTDAANTIPSSPAEIIKYAAQNPRTKHLSARADGVDTGFTQVFSEEFKYTNDTAPRDINLSSYPDINIILSTPGSSPQFTFEVHVTMYLEFKNPLHKSQRITAYKPLNLKTTSADFFFAPDPKDSRVEVTFTGDTTPTIGTYNLNTAMQVLFNLEDNSPSVDPTEEGILVNQVFSVGTYVPASKKIIFPLSDKEVVLTDGVDHLTAPFEATFEGFLSYETSGKVATIPPGVLNITQDINTALRKLKDLDLPVSEKKANQNYLVSLYNKSRRH
ncbi:hypothetical protein [Beihai mantis shrimp virus 2]|uniref:hypothetical protein n=1 Tax=Beihai mantis shrimp virus 2 TaxID=1922429 RepID=UPI00090BF009|nr:hypothetical protein [Beihai mantis shrimp virus 2]APG77580.1 hypothetical protein [Beihai mantis shrimp virus 2]